MTVRTDEVTGYAPVNAEEDRRPAALVAAAELEEALGYLDDSLSKLEARLAAVLTPEIGAPTMNGSPVVSGPIETRPTSDVTSRFAIARARVSDLGMRVDDLMRRLEVG